jgi:hypothetical protein
MFGYPKLAGQFLQFRARALVRTPKVEANIDSARYEPRYQFDRSIHSLVMMNSRPADDVRLGWPGLGRFAWAVDYIGNLARWKAGSLQSRGIKS